MAASQICNENIEIVLVEPRNAGNVGAAARALYNMGLDRLVLVGWVEDVEARRIAYEWATDGERVLKKARRCQSLKQALADCAVAIATSARRGGDRPPMLTSGDLAALLERWTPNNRVAIVFGPERTGLRLEHLRFCSHVLTLPSAPRRLSLNLAQAVLLVGYEILIATGRAAEPAGSRRDSLGRAATRAERQRLYEHAQAALEAIGFLRPGHPLRPLDELCHVLDRAGATSHDVRILRGLCRKILWTAKKRRD